jgi:putative DNA primase/helicase
MTDDNDAGGTCNEDAVEPHAKVIPLRGRHPSSTGADPEASDENPPARASERATPLLHPSDLALADHLRSRFEDFGPATVFAEGAWWQWRGTHYQAVSENETIEWVREFDGIPTSDRGKLRLNKGKIKGILDVLKQRLAAPTYFDRVPRGVNLLNGFVALDANGRPRLVAHAPDLKQRHIVEARWEPGWAPPGALLAHLIRGCFADDPDAKAKVVVLAEMAGAAIAGLSTSVREPKLFVLLGDGANGKSQVLDALTGLVPPLAVTAVPITEWHRDYHRAQLVGKMLNVTPELGSGNTVASERFKAIITGDAVTARQPREPVLTFRCRALHVAATNLLPSFAGGMGPAVMRRLVPLRFDRRVPNRERIANLGLRIAAEEKDALVYYAIRGASRLLRRGDYSIPSSSRNTLLDWAREADPVLGFLDDDRAVILDPAARAASGVIYARFALWCAEHGIRREASLKAFVQRAIAAGRGIGRERSSQQRFLTGVRLP